MRDWGTGSSGCANVKEQHFKVDKRQKILVARTAVQEKDQAGDLQDGRLVRRGGNVDRDRGTSEGVADGSDAHAAGGRWQRLKEPSATLVTDLGGP